MIAGQWLTVQDVAELLQVRIETVRRWVRSGDLPVLEIGGARSVYRIRPDDLNRFVWQRYRSQGNDPSDDQSPAAAASKGEHGHGDHHYQRDDGGPATTTGNGEVVPIVVDAIPAVTYREDAFQPGRLLYISREIEALLGYPASDWVEQRRSWLDHVHAHDRDGVEAELARTSRTGDPFSMEYRMLAHDGRVVWIRCEAALSPDRPGDAHVREGVLVDISEHRRIEESLGLRERQQRAVAELGQHALEGGDLTTLLDEAVSYVTCALDVEYAKIFEVLPGGDKFVLRAGIGWREGHVGEISVPSGEVGSNTVPSGIDYQAGYTLVDRAPVVSEDLASEERFDGHRMVSEHGVHSGASVIIAGRGRPFGVLGAHSTRRRMFDREDVLFLQSVANVLASVVARADMSWLTVSDVAEFLKVTEETVRRWIRHSELPALNLGGPRAGYRVYPSDLERFISDRLIRL